MSVMVKVNNISKILEKIKYYYYIDSNRALLPFYSGFVSKYNIERPVFSSHPSDLDLPRNMTPRDYQIESIVSAYNKLILERSIILNLYTGAGKTFISIYLSLMLQPFNKHIIIYCPSNMLRDHWIETLRKFHQTINFDETFPKFPFDETLGKFHVVTPFNYNKLNGKIKRNTFILIVDEAHLMMTRKRINQMLGFITNYLIFCTATLKQKDTMLLFSNSIITTKYPYPIVINKVLTGIRGSISTNTKTGRVDWEEYIKSLEKEDRRNDILIDIIEEEIENGNILVVCHRTRFVDRISALLDEIHINNSKYYKDMTHYKSSNVLIVSSKKMTGFDEETLCENYTIPSNILIIAQPLKDPCFLTQIVGRIFRSDNPNIFHLVDNDPISRKQWRVCKATYKSLSNNVSIDLW